MAPSLRLIFAIHNHQPVGNFDGVFRQACEDSYDPFLDVLQDFPEIKVTLHNSGSLLEWLEQHRPDYIARVREFVQQGQIEILGGPYYEPILAAIPKHDRVGQIKAYTTHLEQLFGTKVRGMWVPERVWEPNFAADIVDAGIEYTMLDDSHFRWAGVSPDRLHGYYITEDEGRLLSVFPDDERLRYTIPWEKPEETIKYLQEFAEKHPGTVISVGDDGEKFGSWPGTFEHVFGKGWLKKFFTALTENSSWLQVITMAQAVEQVPPLGKVYLPNASYREMTEWALPTAQQISYQKTREVLVKQEGWSFVEPFFRAGFWRNFLVKYPEANDMYCRSREISERLHTLSQSATSPDQIELVERARDQLYHGQCNCPYWHGAFGGLYLPHLRNAIYKHLIAADTLTEQLSGRQGRWVNVEAKDFNLDARKEIKLSGDRLAAYFAPARGGHLYELDVRSTGVNLLATLNRRPEPYHQKLIDAAGISSVVDDVSFNTHQGIRCKQENLHELIAYDRWPRKSLVDHFLRTDVSLDEFRSGNGGVGDFVVGVYQSKLRESETRAEVVMRRDGQVNESPLTVEKTVSLDVAAGGQLEVNYELSGLSPGEEYHFAVEFNVASMASRADDRYYYDSTGRQAGRLETIQALEETDRIGLVDEWLGLDVSLDLSQTGGIWTFPIETVSNSEGGFEAVHQGCVVVPHWKFTAHDSGTWQVKILLTLDTSIAQARALAEVAAR